MDEILLKTLRMQAWERAKAELKSMECTFWGQSEAYQKLSSLVDEFIAAVDDDGLSD